MRGEAEPTARSDRESPMIGASVELAEQIDALGHAISELETRLRPVTRPVDERPEKPDNEPVPGPSSRIVMDLTSYSGSVRNLRRQVSEMTERLDV